MLTDKTMNFVAVFVSCGQGITKIPAHTQSCDSQQEYKHVLHGPIASVKVFSSAHFRNVQSVRMNESVDPCLCRLRPEPVVLVLGQSSRTRAGGTPL